MMFVLNDIRNIHTIPDKLYELTSDRMPNSLMTMDANEGVGENNEQFITKMSTVFGSVLVFFSKLRTQS